MVREEAAIISEAFREVCSQGDPGVTYSKEVKKTSRREGVEEKDFSDAWLSFRRPRENFQWGEEEIGLEAMIYRAV